MKIPLILTLLIISTSISCAAGDAYTRAIADHFDKDPAQIGRLFANGYGRSELITLILISKAANVDLLDVIVMRKHGKKFSEICPAFKVDWNLIQARSLEERNKIDAIVTSAESGTPNGVSPSQNP